MDLYLLDALNRRETVIDKYESLIWTERYNAWGDFEMVLPATQQMRSILTTGKLLAHEYSHRVMMIETIRATMGETGQMMMKVSGRSLETVLQNRVLKTSFGAITTNEQFLYSGTPKGMANAVFAEAAGSGTALQTYDVLTGYTGGSFLPDGNLPYDTTSYSLGLQVGEAYAALQTLCARFKMGFRIVRDPNTYAFKFDVYVGNDRTLLQTVKTPIVFSPDLDNLKNTTEISSIQNFKNIAYVFSPFGALQVTRPGTDQYVTGLDRRVIFVDCSDWTDSLTATDEMTRRGLAALAEHSTIFAFDGEIPQASTFKYDTMYSPSGYNYGLGDLVQLKATDGNMANMYVTEQIFVSDAEGERSYPTLSVDLLVTPGSWAGWNFTQVWQDMGATTYWSTV